MKILALGGPLNLQWLDEDTGYRDYVVPLFTPVSLNFDSEISPIDLDRILETGRYRISKLADANTKTIKKVYVYQDITLDEAEKILKGWLLLAFINMEAPE